MKIPNRFPRFERAAVLLVVASRREAELYVIHDGVMSLAGYLYETAPEYTDKEGIFKRRGGGLAASSGVAKERNIGERAFRGFVQRARIALKEMDRTHKPLAIVMLAPRHSADAILEAEPRRVRDRTMFVAAVNYVKKHPMEILEKIGAVLRKIEAAPRKL